MDRWNIDLGWLGIERCSYSGAQGKWLPSKLGSLPGGKKIFLYFNSFNSLAPGECGSNSKSKIFKLYRIVVWALTAVRWMPQNLTNEKLTLVQVIPGSLVLSITWAFVDADLCCHIASLGHNELRVAFLSGTWNMYLNLLCHSFMLKRHM